MDFSSIININFFGFTRILLWSMGYNRGNLSYFGQEVYREQIWYKQKLPNDIYYSFGFESYLLLYFLVHFRPILYDHMLSSETVCYLRTKSLLAKLQILKKTISIFIVFFSVCLVFYPTFVCMFIYQHIKFIGTCRSRMFYQV